MSESPSHEYVPNPYLNGRIILIDKPLGWTSFDAVKKIRSSLQKAFKIKKLKVGHAGTLDPLATGLLVLCTGNATKQIAHLTADEKIYTGTFCLGATTPSFDLETEVQKAGDASEITKADVEKAASELTGEFMQMPPVYSAKWVDGKRAYEAARKGEHVALTANKVTIKKFTTDCSELPKVHFEITCSKGTYIRAVARDLGEKLGCGAYLYTLRRTASGSYLVKDALTPEAFRSALYNEITEKASS